MFLEKFHSPGLAHLSYLLGDKGQAAVIDPRRDCEFYVDAAARQGAQITHIFETHRNEDYVVGSLELRARTGAEVYHGKALDFEYGNAAKEKDEFRLGDCVLRILETPGHTYESISIVLADAAYNDDPVAVFTGDALFVGEVGRTDFFPDEAEHVAGLLYDSIHEALLPLGDHVLLYPAHGKGSVCGDGMASREFSTLGSERRNSPKLQLSREAFIEAKVQEHHIQPPYFQKMEEYNLKGNAPRLSTVSRPMPMAPERFAEAYDNGARILDVRTPEALAGALIPGSLGIPLETIPAYAGMFLDYGQPIILVTPTGADTEAQTAARYLMRLGYDNCVGFLEGGLHEWERGARKFDRVGTVHVAELKRRIANDEAFTLLDVRAPDEYMSGHLDGAVNIHFMELPDRLDEVPVDRPVTTFCGSGLRAMVAATILKANGFEQVEDTLGSMEACQSAGCPLV